MKCGCGRRDVTEFCGKPYPDGLCALCRAEEYTDECRRNEARQPRRPSDLDGPRYGEPGYRGKD